MMVSLFDVLLHRLVLARVTEPFDRWLYGAPEAMRRRLASEAAAYAAFDEFLEWNGGPQRPAGVRVASAP